MKLLFDHNLSQRLVEALADLYPGSAHVLQLSLASADDSEIWEFAREKEYIIVTKDQDFNDLSFLQGFPPKVIWIQRGDCSTKEAENWLRVYHEQIETFSNDETIAVLPIP